MRRTAAVALVAALSLTGCSMPSTGPGGADAGTVEAPPEPLGTEAAGEQFLQIVAPYDGVRDQFEEAVDSEAPLEQQTGLAAAVAAALRAEAEGLHRSAWPDEVAADAHALAATIQEAAGHWEGAAAAESKKEVMKHVDQAMKVDDGGAEAAIRETLGLADAGASE
ncbi:hypothetical protein [Myceligenerans pegani]|uniref:Uncharacterized protein n=1 Tax=Myceligenerans pegani TaxID=2776917 RepID=A0ABR9N0Y9_9MICO|nr:hypothetical protein [Myceligenerans sp. TRM 65318]MBE1877318.1 hypothetical protein [Myceligenerans sp. TRM 65318]MBE3019589.1 hypothetical protein [Myceligenerans sp. TRM 65318]